MAEVSLNEKVYAELYLRLIRKELRPGDLIDRH